MSMRWARSIWIAAAAVSSLALQPGAAQEAVPVSATSPEFSPDGGATQAAEARANTIAVRLMAPLFICIFPATFIVLLYPLVSGLF